MPKKPRLWHWIKYHWHIVRWLPFGKRLWNYADAKMDDFYERRDAAMGFRS